MRRNNGSWKEEVHGYCTASSPKEYWQKATDTEKSRRSSRGHSGSEEGRHQLDTTKPGPSKWKGVLTRCRGERAGQPWQHLDPWENVGTRGQHPMELKGENRNRANKTDSHPLGSLSRRSQPRGKFNKEGFWGTFHFVPNYSSDIRLYGLKLT